MRKFIKSTNPKAPTMGLLPDPPFHPLLPKKYNR